MYCRNFVVVVLNSESRVTRVPSFFLLAPKFSIIYMLTDLSAWSKLSKSITFSFLFQVINFEILGARCNFLYVWRLEKKKKRMTITPSNDLVALLECKSYFCLMTSSNSFCRNEVLISITSLSTRPSTKKFLQY